MRKLPIILTLILIAVWGYTCWHWYTCNIKGFCDTQTNYPATQIVDNGSYTDTQEIEPEDDIVGVNTESPPTLSAEDVLFDPLPKEREEDTAPKENITESGSLDASSDTQGQEVVIEVGEEDRDTLSRETTICEEPLIGPIVFGGENNQQEVEKLEAFLISRGESVSIDGEYGDSDFEAMKKFQLEYKSEVLDPWGITTPTGYVGKTSIAKINEIACK